MANKTLLLTILLGFVLGLGLSSFDDPKQATRASSDASRSEREIPEIQVTTSETVRPATVTSSHVPTEAAWEQVFPNSREVWTREERAANGKLRRERLLETRYKFPFIRVEDEIGNDGRTSTLAAFVADHLLVKLKSGKSENELLDFLRRHDLELRRKLSAPKTFLVGFRADAPERFDEVRTLLRSQSELFERVDRDDIALRERNPP